MHHVGIFSIVNKFKLITLIQSLVYSFSCLFNNCIDTRLRSVLCLGILALVDICILQRLIDLQGDDSSTETKQDKPKQDDPVVDLFPDDDTEERNSKSPELFFRGR